MEAALVEPREVTVLRMALWHATNGGYDGPGKDWHRRSKEVLTDRIARGDHIPLLRSLEFAQKFRPWGLCVVGYTLAQTATLDDALEFLVPTRITPQGLNRWKEHHAAIQGTDPLEYIAPYIW